MPHVKGRWNFEGKWKGVKKMGDVNPSPAKKQKVYESPKKGNVKGGIPSCNMCGQNHWGNVISRVGSVRTVGRGGMES
jgi:hypothetical protein